jgi:hypothetical protein
MLSHRMLVCVVIAPHILGHAMLAPHILALPVPGSAPSGARLKFCKGGCAGMEIACRS